jgi:acetoacetate decarboxylase
MLAGTPRFGSVLCAVRSMGYKNEELDPGPALRELACPNFLIKIIPHVDGGPRICELVRYWWQDVALKGVWCGRGALQLFANALGNVAKRPVLNVLSGTHFVANVTVGIGRFSPAFRRIFDMLCSWVLIHFEGGVRSVALPVCSAL